MKKAAVVLVALVIVLLVVPAGLRAGRPLPNKKLPLNPTTLALAAGFGVAIAAFWLRTGPGTNCRGPLAKASLAIPGATDGVRGAMILGLVFVETLTLFTFAIGFPALPLAIAGRIHYCCLVVSLSVLFCGYPSLGVLRLGFFFWCLSKSRQNPSIFITPMNRVIPKPPRSGA